MQHHLNMFATYPPSPSSLCRKSNTVKSSRVYIGLRRAPDFLDCGSARLYCTAGTIHHVCIEFWSSFSKLSRKVILLLLSLLHITVVLLSLLVSVYSPQSANTHHFRQQCNLHNTTITNIVCQSIYKIKNIYGIMKVYIHPSR